MKNLLILIACGMVLFTSCSKENPEEIATDYIGTWAGDALCSEESEAVVLVITQGDSDSDLNILFTDDDESFDDSFSINGAIESEDLVIASQTINADEEFDVITMQGTGSINDASQLVISLNHTVDGEAQTCTLELLKR